ncbi:family 43 glycosylhydrolase [Sphingomonas sp.]|uniref:family 43 glycosylhydrolase n=1 Tax=Sphingomonas sp. TaxID=28214 RepID=UPI00257C8C62|nr:family 43 glycosylhydrolase [Sphingomonas sp.]
MAVNRRDLLAGGVAGLGLTGLGASAAASHAPAAVTSWRRGADNQRIADLGDGRFLNPILAGDHPDPAILKDGADYYMTFSSFDSYPGPTIWHSRDLVNWQPRGAALTRNIGSVWAVSLEKHKGRYFLYVPVKATPDTIYVLWADHIDGPWSDPIDLDLHGHIDPCHAVGEDGSRWLFLSGGDRVRLSDDGLSLAGVVEHVYDPWHYPADWVVESFSPEGPKIHRHNGYYYMITAVGGTAGPPTGHMVIVARSRSIHGPWENDPANPVVRTRDEAERWWSRGHASLVEGPDGSWWSVYHGYENGYWTLGRQALLDPVEWTAGGWFRMRGGDLSAPLPKPRGGRALPHGQTLSDDFATLALGRKWNFFRPAVGESERARVADGALYLRAKGIAPHDSSPLMLIAGDQAYRFECDIEIDPGVTAGLLLFYDDRLYCGLGFDAARFVTHQYGAERGRPANPHGRRMRMRVTNDRHIVSYHISGDGGRSWTRFDRGMEVSGYHHNVRGGFLMLRPALYAAGTGEARFRDFTFRAL